MAAQITSIIGLQNLINLEQFRADFNSLTTIDLSGLTSLNYIDISDNNIPGTFTNSLTSVNLTGCTALEQLRLDDSDFSAGIPNLTGLTSLQYIDMDQCSISGNVDLSMLPALTGFDLSGNTGITSVTIFEQVLNDVDLFDAALTEESVNDILGWLDGGGVLNGYVNLSEGTNAIPTGAGITAKDSLEAKGWAVYVNVPPPPLILGWDDIANANTLVGDASIVSNWNTLFDLPTNGTPFTSVIVVGNDVELYGGSGINLKNDLFRDNTHISFVDDNDGNIITAGSYCFFSCPLITSFNLPALTSTGMGCFRNCPLIVEFNFPSLISAGFSSFASCPGVTTFNLPSLISSGAVCFSNCYSVTTFNLPSCTNLGGTVANNNSFLNITGETIAATFNGVLATCNGGNPDGDIQYLEANNTVTVTYV